MLSWIASLTCLFLPPSGWEMAQPKAPSTDIQIGFFATASTNFRPSINFAIEKEIESDLKQYIKAVKSIHTEDPKTRYRDLGPLTTKAGEGRLIELTKPSPFGEMKVLQSIIVQDNTAYILTAAVLKEDFARYQAAILETFRSMELVTDLFSPISDLTKQTELKALFDTLGSSHNRATAEALLQKHIRSIPELGSYWKFLVLKEGLAKINQEASL